MAKKLEGKVAVITGGNSGIGLATAKEFSNQGAQVVILARNQEKLDQAIAEIGNNATGFVGDVTDLSSLKSLFDNVAKDFGKVDIVFTGAGIFNPATLGDTDEALFDQQVGVNFKGVFFTVKYAAPHLNDGASVILVSSCLNEIGLEGGSIYSGAKAAVRALARGLTPELAKVGARVNVLSPGPVDTPIHANRGLNEKEVDEFWALFTKLPAGRVGNPTEMAKAALFLASSDSSYFFGSEIQADGGMNQVRWYG